MYEKCFDVDEIFFFEPEAKKHLPFFSYATKHRKQHFPSFRSSPFFICRSNRLCYEDDYPTYAWMNVYECKCYDVMRCANEWSNDHTSSHTHNHYFLKNNHTSALHSLRNDFGASSPLLLAESALTFRCKLCIPLGTTLELLRLYFLALDGAFSAFTFTFLGGLCSYRTKKGNYMCWPH
jgi:hypothetical protein